MHNAYLAELISQEYVRERRSRAIADREAGHARQGSAVASAVRRGVRRFVNRTA